MFLVASKLDAAGVKDGGAPTRVWDFAAEVDCWAPAPPAYSGGKRMAAYVVANIEVTDAAL
jgi:hypothetical protein